MSTVAVAGRRRVDTDRPPPLRRGPLPARAVVSVVVAAGAAFVTSLAWYTAFAEPYADLVAASAATSPSPPVAMAVELGRSLVVSAVLALLVRHLDVARVRTGLGVAALAWVAFPATLVVGSVVHDGVPVALAAIHAGDWLVKLLVVTTILVKIQLRGTDRS